MSLGSNRGAKILIRRLSTPARHNPRLSILRNDLRKILGKTLSAQGIDSILSSPALNVNLDAHQRLPPSSPFRQSSPRVYFPTHSDSSSLSNLRRDVAPPFFSHTTTDPGSSENSS